MAKEPPRRTLETHLSVAERVALGRAARKRTPRSSHAQLQSDGRPRDPLGLLARQAESRVPELVPIRYGRMLVSPLTFYRGAAVVMAGDLAHTPTSGFQVQCCGDAHLSNFGVFASPERRLVFDINDFDETLPGPWEWDVKRLGASLLIAAQENGFAVEDQEQAVLDAVAQYREAMVTFAGWKNLEVFYAVLDTAATLAEFGSQLQAKAVKRTERSLAKARTRDSMQAFAKLVRERDGAPRIVADPPLIVPIADLAEGAAHGRLLDGLRDLLAAYEDSLQPDRRVLLQQFVPADFARKVVGVGSVGTRTWIALLLGRDQKDPLFLQLKEAEASVLEPHLQESTYENHGERVVAGQRLMQSSSDIFLGWLRVKEPHGRIRDFYGRQLKDWKGSAVVEQMDPSGLAAYGRLCGWTLARAHARSGDRIAIASYLSRGSGFDRAIVEFAAAYAEQNARDHRALAAAVESGSITAETGL